MEVLMEVGIIKELDEKMNQERLRLIALGRAKEAELGKKEGELFSTVLITEVQHIVRGGFWIAGGYYTLFDKSIKILASSMNDRMSSDEIMLHELAHGLDHATDGFKTRPNYHDERFIAAARTLGAGVSRYVKDSKQRKLEEEYEEEKWQSYVPPEFSAFPADSNNCSLIFEVSKRPALISRCSFQMAQAYTGIYGDWKKDICNENKYVMCGWGPRENIELAHKLFPELKNAVRNTTRKHAINFPSDDRNGVIEGLKYGFIYNLREHGFKHAAKFDLSEIDKDFAYQKANFPNAPLQEPWIGFHEGQQIAEDMMGKDQKKENDNE